MTDTLNDQVKQAAGRLDEHVREMIRWHFDPHSGTPFWLEYARQAGWNPLEQVQCFADLLRFEHFDDDALRFVPHEKLVPGPYKGLPFTVFETGGTTGMPKQRIGWEDYQTDYADYARLLDDEIFPRGGYWLSMGPTGPRRLRLSLEYLANQRGCSCYFIDLDARWVKKLIANKRYDEAKTYMEHVVDQTLIILKHRQVDAIFTTPKLLEALSEKIDLPEETQVKAVFCAGTEMNPQMVRFLIEEVLDNRIRFIPIYGNTLMGLATALPVTARDNYSISYYPPQPRAVIRVVDPKNTDKLVDYGQWGRVELTTLTRELFMPRFLERDEVARRKPCESWPWDGVADVRPFGSSEKKVVEGVY